MTSERLAKTVQTTKLKKKRVSLSQKRLQTLITKGQLLTSSFGTTEAAKLSFDSSDLRTEKDKAALLLWVYTSFTTTIHSSYADE